MRTSLGGSVARAVDPAEAASMPLRVAIICTATLFVVGGLVLAVLSWETLYSSPAAHARRHLDAEVRAGRGCLLSREWAQVDPETGLVVVRIARAVSCGGVPEVEQSPWPLPGDPDDFIDGWNEALRRHLAAGEPCGPRFLDRVTTLPALRERFRRDADAAIELPRHEDMVIGDHEVRWWGSSVIVRNRGAKRFLQPAGGAPVEPELDRDAIVVTALPADAGRSLWVRVASKTGGDLWYFVVDLATGTNFQVFDASADRR